MKKAIFSGTFDPITLGHMDIISRSAKKFDKLIVAVIADDCVATKMPANLRIASVTAACSKLSNIDVVGFSGLLVDFAKTQEVTTLIRSLRSADDFQYEYRMALMNNAMQKQLETVFFMSDPKFAMISSTLVRQILSCNGEVKHFLPSETLQFLEGIQWR
jgi:pantetheine-phosphate adenylyltransferase